MDLNAFIYSHLCVKSHNFSILSWNVAFRCEFICLSVWQKQLHHNLQFGWIEVTSSLKISSSKLRFVGYYGGCFLQVALGENETKNELTFLNHELNQTCDCFSTISSVIWHVNYCQHMNEFPGAAVWKKKCSFWKRHSSCSHVSRVRKLHSWGLLWFS